MTQEEKTYHCSCCTGHEECEHRGEIKEIFSRYRPGQALLVGNGDSQRYWKLREKCEKECEDKHYRYTSMGRCDCSNAHIEGHEEEIKLDNIRDRIDKFNKPGKAKMVRSGTMDAVRDIEFLLSIIDSYEQTKD